MEGEMMFDFTGLAFIAVALGLGYFTGKLTGKLRITSIVGFIIAGILLGPIFHVVEISSQTSSLIVDFTLSLVALVIGLGFSREFVRRIGMPVFQITVGETFLAFLFVTTGIYLVTRNLPMALIFGALAPASAPAGTIAALQEAHANGRFAHLVRGVVGFDDAFSILIFVVGLVAAEVLIGGTLSWMVVFQVIFLDIMVAVALGIVFGMLLAALTKVFDSREDFFLLAIIFALSCTVISEMLDASFIISCIILGTTYIFISPRHAKISHDKVEKFLPPVYILFFLVAGFELNPTLLLSVGLIGVTYIVTRFLGLYTGARLGSMWAKTTKATQKYIGFSILSQAGVAIGLALLVSKKLNDTPSGREIGMTAITVIMATTVVFEIFGPIGVKYSLSKIKRPPKSEEAQLLSRLRKKADEIDVFSYDIDDDISVYSKCDEEELIYDICDDTRVKNRDSGM